MLKRLATTLAWMIISLASHAHPERFVNAAEIIQFFDDEPDVVWPGFHFHDAPTIIHQGTPELLAFDFTTEDASWTPVVDLARPALFTLHDPQNIHHIKFHPTYLIDNQYAYVFGFTQTDDGKDRDYQAFVHEKFHGFQGQYFKNLHTTGSYADHSNSDIQYLVYLENKTLAVLLQDLSSIEKMKDVIAVYETRRPLMQPISRDWEDWQTRMEGIAEYVDVDTFLKLPILDKDPLSMLAYYSERNFGWSIEAPMNLVDSAIKWRYYSVGAISALALDTLNLDWKDTVANGKSPMDVLSAHFNMSAADIKMRFDTVKQTWHSVEQQQKIIDDISAYGSILNEIDENYANTPGTEIQWNLFNCASGAVMDNSYYLFDGSHVALGISEDKTCSKDNNRYTRKMQTHPVVYSSAKLLAERFKVNGAILIDGKPFDAATLPDSGVFHQLKITSPTLNATYEGKGCYENKGDGLLLNDCSIDE